MNREILTVEEQQPVGDSIWCNIQIDGGTISYGNMYFVCNLKKEITQYYVWIKEQRYKRQLIKLGYKL